MADLQVPPDLTSAVPTQAGEAARTARRWADATATLAARLKESAGEHRSGRNKLLDEARATLPAGFPLALVTDLEELVQAVRATARELVAQAAEARKDAEQIAVRLAEKRALQKEVEAARRESQVFQDLAGELRADRLISFLQGEALELLAEAGSQRLLFLSQERYRLVFEDDEFYVEDRQNGDERRSVRTLSGGETFLASLALALALAEQIPAVAVTQRSRLQSLFIDEGFGALDPESLEVATEALSRLGGQDRLVGVVTHVSDLAEKMPVRVVVEKLPTGSRLEVVS
jgi:exonuclease SbcC